MLDDRRHRVFCESASLPTSTRSTEGAPRGEDEVAQVVLGPAGSREDRGMLGHDHEQSARVLVDQGARARMLSTKSRASCSGSIVCRASICMTDRITIAVTCCRTGESVFSVKSRPRAVLLVLARCRPSTSPASPESPGRAYGDAGRSTLMQASRMARPIVALARNPEPKMLPRLFRPISSRMGPLTTRNGAVPVVLCQIPLGGVALLGDASHAARTTGKVLGPASGHGGVDRRCAHRECRFRWVW